MGNNIQARISGKNNSITINGKTFVGNTVIVSNGEVFVDGVKQEDSAITGTKIVNITVEGDVDNVSTVSGNITVKNSAKKVTSTSGDVHITGDVNTANTVSGDICAKSITNASSVSGNIRK